MILISTKFAHKAKVSFQLRRSDCEILMLDICLPGCLPFSVANVYFPHGVIDSDPLDLALSSAEPPVVFAGDFNSHHTAWGFRTDSCGLRLLEWISDNNLTCVNSDSPTYIKGLTRSVLDLTIRSRGVKVSSWSTVDCGTSSDHVPIVFDIEFPVRSLVRQNCTFVNYKKFEISLKEAIFSLAVENPTERATGLCAALTSSAQSALFEVRSKRFGSPSPWWNDECARSFRRRKAAWKKLCYNQCPLNWSNYKYFAAMFKRTVSKAKHDYDSQRCSFLSEPKNKRALFRFLRSRKVLPPIDNIDSLVLSTSELYESLEMIARGLQSRFSSALATASPPPIGVEDFVEVTTAELFDAMAKMPAAAPGPDKVTTAMLKLLFDQAPNDLLNMINYSLRNAWIPGVWRLAKILPIPKNGGQGLAVDNIRPIALTSNVVKLIERILLQRIMQFVVRNSVLSPSQIGFRPGCSIWSAHIDLESRIKLARRYKQVAALVTLDIAKAYDSVEYPVLLSRLQNLNFPRYIIAWLYEFLKDRQFSCVRDNISSSWHFQKRGVPQGAVLSPALFNVLLSSVPVVAGVHTYVYADDIAFFTSAADIQ